jgi:hypothetical protein
MPSETRYSREETSTAPAFAVSPGSVPLNRIRARNAGMAAIR